jgi:hypothetical protein
LVKKYETYDMKIILLDSYSKIFPIAYNLYIINKINGYSFSQGA